MRTIDFQILRELFYKLYFIGYKDFITNRQVCFGMLYDHKTMAKPIPFGNPYNMAITKYNSLSDTQNQVNLDKLPQRDFSDLKIMNSVDCFFEIIRLAQPETINYVYDLLHFMRDGGSQDDDTLLQIEETIFRLILDYFWDRSGIKALTITKKIKGISPKDDEFEYEKEISLNRDDFFKGLEQHKYTYFDVISMIGSLLGGPGAKYYSLIDFLHAIRKIRNGSAHARKDGNYNFSTASVLNRFRLYTYIVTVLYLQNKFAGTIPEYSCPVSLHVQSMDEMSSDDIEVSLCDENGNKLETARFVNGICSFSIERYKKYKVMVKNSIDIEPTWDDLNPMITLKSNKLDYYHNEFEVPTAVRGATLRTVVELNQKVHETLTVISGDVEQIAENTKPLNKIAEYVAKLSAHKDEETKIAQQQTTILRGLQQLMETLVLPISKQTDTHDEAASEWDIVMGKIDKIYEEGQALKEDINNTREYLSHKLDRNTKWIIGSIIGFSMVLIGLLILVLLNIPSSSVEKISNLSAKEFLELGDSLLNASDYKGAGSAYRKAIDQFKDQIARNDNDVEARIQLGRMYYLGKGALNGDSAFYYINHKAVRADRHGRGVYTYCLFAKGRVEDAKKELKSIGIDDNDDYVRLTSALLELSGESSEQLTTVYCNKLINRLFAIGTEEAIIGAAFIHYGGIRNKIGEYLIAPHIGLYYNVIKHLAPKVPLMYLYLSQISAFLGREVRAAEYATHAFDCGIHEEGSLMLASLCAQGVYGTTEETTAFLDYAASLASQMDNTLTLASNLSSYINHGDFDLAIKAADQLEEMLKDSTRKEFISFKPSVEEMENLRISLRLQSGKKEHFREAVKMALAKSRCKDSLAIALYLEAVQWAKAYGCTQDSVKSDSLINLSAELGYEEAVYSRLRRADYPTLYVDENKGTKGYGYLKLGWGVDIQSLQGNDGFLEVSNAAIVPDSIWKGNKKLTEYLAYYWKDLYIYTNQTSPYLSSCSKVFQFLYDLEKKYREGLMKNQVISDSERTFYTKRMLILIPEAFYSKNYSSFVSLCREFCLFSEYTGIPSEIVLAYKQFVDDMKKNFSIKPDDPIYAY